ncbi:hypothetical protein BASA61_002857 [Batrachochytrium salamandrivorans]|nr:hypothetical protein BASA61_002857 [Batrachochytrium salamandrivorans]
MYDSITVYGSCSLLLSLSYTLFFQGLVSSCSGQKKALLVGIVYRGSEKVLEGCINDTTIMKKFLVQKFNFNPADIRVLSEDMADTSLHPTRANIIAGFNWLVAGTQPGDSLVFQYSGHGGQISDLDGDESDGLDELIFPLDHKDAGVIIDDEMNRFLVRNLPRGVRLTAIFDCCHSGSALDLPFTYAPNGRIKENTPMAKLSRMAKGTTSLLMRGNVKRAMTRIQDGFKQLKIRAQSQNEKVATKGSLVADVILFAGCKDSETSSDAKINGKATGAMTYALTKVLKEGATPTYGVLLNKIRRILAEHFSQTPQISSARYMDMSQPFIM